MASEDDVSTAGRRSPRDVLVWAITTFVLLRGLLFLFEAVAVVLVPWTDACRPQWNVFGPHHEFWNGFFRWDAAFYRTIAESGYQDPSKHGSVAFYPLFPYLARYLGLVLGGPLVAGLVISNVGTISALYFMARLGDLLFPRTTTDRAAVYLLLFPMSFFLSAYYTEGLFVGLATAAMYQFQRNRYAAAGALGALSLMARSSGLPLFLAFATDLAFRIFRKRERFEPSMLGVLLVPLGLVAFMAILYFQVHDPFAFEKVMKNWNRRPSLPWMAIVEGLVPITKMVFGSAVLKPYGVQRAIDVLTAVAFLLIAGAMIVKRYPLHLAAFVLFGALLPLFTTNVASMGRYVLVLFPAYYWLGDVLRTRPRAEYAFLLASVFFLAIYGIRFFGCGFAG